jgi:alpha-tubulin suppressor-like RCC1 family protein
MRNREIYCWGQGAFRALGGDYNAQLLPRKVDAIADAVALDSGARYGCAKRSTEDVWCWGDNGRGQIGDNATIPCGDCTPLPDCATSVCVPTPQPMAGLESGVAELALGGEHGCARLDDGHVVCWGDNSSGQVGQQDLSQQFPTPALVAGVTGAVQVAAGVSHTCALIGSPGQVMCWGKNDRAQVGNGEVSDTVVVPTIVAGLDDAVEVVGGGSHTCARRQDGAVVCWGYNYLGALGNGSTEPTRATSIQNVVDLNDAVALAAGDYFTCALRSAGTVACWGDNGHGQLGDGTAAGEGCADRNCRTSPVQVLVVTGAVIVNAGDLHACAADAAGRLWCWGYNLGGQLGTGSVSSEPTSVPVEVQGLPN